MVKCKVGDALSVRWAMLKLRGGRCLVQGSAMVKCKVGDALIARWAMLKCKAGDALIARWAMLKCKNRRWLKCECGRCIPARPLTDHTTYAVFTAPAELESTHYFLGRKCRKMFWYILLMCSQNQQYFRLFNPYCETALQPNIQIKSRRSFLRLFNSSEKENLQHDI